MKILNIKRKLRQIDSSNWEVKIERHGQVTHGRLVGRVADFTLEAHQYLRDGETVEDFLAKDVEYYTLLRDGTEYDPGADYNPNGYRFCRKINDIDYYLAQVKTA